MIDALQQDTEQLPKKAVQINASLTADACVFVFMLCIK